MIGMGAGKAAADDAPESTTSTTVAPEPTGREAELAEAGELSKLMGAIPPPKPKPAPVPTTTTPAPVPEETLPPEARGLAPAPKLFSDPSPREGKESEKSSANRVTPGTVTAQPAAAEEAAAQPSAPEPAKSPAAPAQPATAASAAVTTASQKSTDAAVSPTANVLQPEDVWWPGWTEDLVDQKIAAAWRLTPVRGPPPGTASALGNDGQTSITQVAIVDGPDGVEVDISYAQTAKVNNLGYAQADASGPGDARAVGDKASTAIYQTSVVVQKGTGTATVAQDANVDNVGYAIAATAGADADAVGNESATTIHQTAVVVILGSGDGTVVQGANVRNIGGATAVATEKPASAAGNRSTTHVNQVGLVVVHDEDRTLTQTSNTDNIGLAAAIGATSTGNVATNSVEQVAALRS